MTYAIKAKFDSELPAENFHHWLRTAEGLAGWWSDDTSGSALAEGDRFEVRFPTSPVAFELRVSESGDRAVAWTIDENPPWWKGTTIRFEITDTDQGSELIFTHEGFAPDDPIIAVITPAWVRFIDNLVDVARSGEPDPAVRN